MRASFRLRLGMAALLCIAFASGTPEIASADSSQAEVAGGSVAGGRYVRIVDFESGSAPLQSYDGEDHDPSSWSIQSQNTYGGSQYALRIWGNSWKELAITPLALTTATVLQAAIYTEERAELNAIGFADGSGNVLFYCVHGSQLQLLDNWNVVFQGLNPIERWFTYLLPVGRDWNDTWGYVPTIDRVIFVNDRDSGMHGITVFDEIYDVTADLPVAPTVEIDHYVRSIEEVAQDPHDTAQEPLYRVEVQFSAQVHDPDSPTHVYHWDFGDGATSADPAPIHVFTAHADYSFTTALDVADETDLFGRDTCQVAVEPSGAGSTHSINFVGDVFMGRGYDGPGGLIDTYGIEYLFDPTLDMLGRAADITVANAENAFTDRGEPHPTKSVVFRTSPENIAGLVYAGVDVASNGNNHIIDYGREGLEQTLDVMDVAGIVHGGAGSDEYEALQPCYYTDEGVRLSFINFCNRTGRADNEQPFFDAGPGKHGLGWWLEPNNERAIAQAESLSDIVIAFPHSGEEYAVVPPLTGGGAPPSATPIDVEQCPPYIPESEVPSFRFRIWPGLSDLDLRRHAIDCGADAVLNSHPHVLQGFEVYEGCLIAHSLGNFLFDLSYPETMPTMVLRARFDKDGIISWYFRPAFIDDWIPRPATGRLGREILDRMADYSRVLGALVGVDAENMQGQVFLDPDDITPVPTVSHGSAPLHAADGYYVSDPIELAGAGSLAQVLALSGVPAAGAEIRIGSEVLWFGGFEYDEGHSMWNLNSQDEWLDESQPYAGRYCLRLHRQHGGGGTVTTMLSANLPAADSLDYSIMGWMSADNAHQAVLSLRFYRQRYETTPLLSHDAMDPVDGTQPYQWYSSDVDAPDGTAFFNVRCALDAPGSGDGYARFDEVRVAEWLPWQPAALPLAVPYPNNMRFIQVRTPQAAGNVTVDYEEIALTPGGLSGGGDIEPQPETRVLLAGAAPNPCLGETQLRYRLSAAAQVTLEVFDLNGRMVSRLAHDERQRPGWHRIPWVSGDKAAGIYFMRLTVDGEEHARKIVVMH